ncbi:hypothetical protein TMatcc_007360 [Talaromyces marneffei ATCC 18224]|uniref:Glucose-methanol-choline (Gmc) oxidoreductase, putative n=1 Tax=Talaromyces marneffei (strain ATCC 18224 / CBS 334.59 / QM 7333) TaxID=441960 RepID=B6QFP5_TALMQ|nr:uncharacterized protein EYB26_004329 [Talaromyces marneffei]EEA24280.1 glucose-methanol-choline (gmc) oxidoreductase, putative [Talaromyces marneffei ATCC 18224]KAE8553209.1 hypothetical protein EYB25_004591 [Talaromyces marneffei]QGA16662.1 hypothetical protein EYB26_004329 [Talaromyces marneffei]
MAPPEVNEVFDIIIVGGGTAGCVVASRLRQRKPTLSILVLEAGGDLSKNPHVYSPETAPLLLGSDADWKYTSVPQVNLNGREIYYQAGKGVSGSAAVNMGAWTRGDAQEYDRWADLVSDQRWSYEGLLPYFKRTEHHYNPHVGDAEQHGFKGPIHTSSVSSSGRQYPLRETLRQAWCNTGLKGVDDANNGHPQGVTELVSNWADGRRQLTSEVYPLHGAVNVVTNALVRRVILDSSFTATGVELADGRIYSVRNGGEVIVSTGALRTPQILMLSGIGDSKQLSKYNIREFIHLPEIGRNFHDHLLAFRYWKLREPEKGVALGSPLFGGPNFEKGVPPEDWLVTTTISSTGLHSAQAKDDENGPVQEVVDLRSHLELATIYAAFGGELIGLDIPMDGSAIMSFIMGFLPTSRGSITLKSADPADPPVIDPNFFATEADRFVMREGWRLLSRLMFETPEGKDLVAEEIVPEGHRSLESDAPDDLIDAHIQMGGMTGSHFAGTASMGSVVDGSLKVRGTQGLRVVDASVIPTPLACHYQAAVYAIAEQAVDIVLQENPGL